MPPSPLLPSPYKANIYFFLLFLTNSLMLDPTCSSYLNSVYRLFNRFVRLYFYFAAFATNTIYNYLYWINSCFMKPYWIQPFNHAQHIKHKIVNCNTCTYKLYVIKMDFIIFILLCTYISLRMIKRNSTLLLIYLPTA